VNNSPFSEKDIEKGGIFLRAIILAGGKGKRLYPITASIPKPMAKICNEPCIGRIINLLHRHGIYDIAITLGYKGRHRYGIG